MYFFFIFLHTVQCGVSPSLSLVLFECPLDETTAFAFLSGRGLLSMKFLTSVTLRLPESEKPPPPPVLGYSVLRRFPLIEQGSRDPQTLNLTLHSPSLSSLMASSLVRYSRYHLSSCVVRVNLSHFRRFARETIAAGCSDPPDRCYLSLDVIDVNSTTAHPPSGHRLGESFLQVFQDYSNVLYFHVSAGQWVFALAETVGSALDHATLDLPLRVSGCLTVGLAICAGSPRFHPESKVLQILSFFQFIWSVP
jgi:hypothetical protein